MRFMLASYRAAHRSSFITGLNAFPILAIRKQLGEQLPAYRKTYRKTGSGHRKTRQNDLLNSSDPNGMKLSGNSFTCKLLQ